MQILADEFPAGALAMQHAISCDLPNDKVGSLIGKGGEHITHVEKVSGTKIKFSEADHSTDSPFRTLTIQGALISCYCAHMMMMKKYHESGEEAHGRDRESSKVASLQSQLKDLEAQLEAAKRSERGERGGGGGGKKGGGKSRR
eukprot:gnl/TRDRNA2_/TRDRNA2_128914_c1_seq1.p1 gnl/TRDRNA2_/TRDRNA2_128914_c1~~gnl/TRDRNA2_/TRDRNA2_128914_c1_seq1.p1  ORF type:complete len:144 (+),score=43.36 gnl/TRDRNA2_/TRDRNA2_128914_c1_seq1:266-697(+)